MRKMLLSVSRALVGKTLKQAREIADQNEATIRVVEENGVELDSDHLFRSNRVNVSIDNGKVSKVISLG
jgi:hypothetical protein